MPHIMPRMSVERPWVVSYPSDVPRSIAPFPSESVFGLLESAAGRFPDRPAIAWFGKHLSYKQLLREVERCSAMLAGLGIRKGDRVALIMPNSPPFTIAFYACMRIGAVVRSSADPAERPYWPSTSNGTSVIVPTRCRAMLASTIRSTYVPRPTPTR